MYWGRNGLKGFVDFRDVPLVILLDTDALGTTLSTDAFPLLPLCLFPNLILQLMLHEHLFTNMSGRDTARTNSCQSFKSPTTKRKEYLVSASPWRPVFNKKNSSVKQFFLLRNRTWNPKIWRQRGIKYCTLTRPLLMDGPT